MSGSFALGFILVLVIERFPPSRYVRPFFATGSLGAFTTFSTLAVGTDLLIKDGHASLGIVYVLTSLMAGVAAVCAGMAGALLNAVGSLVVGTAAAAAGLALAAAL